MDFTQWFCKSVVLQIAIGPLRVPVWGTVLGGTERTVRFQIDGRFVIDIEKSEIEAVVEVDQPTSCGPE